VTTFLLIRHAAHDLLGHTLAGRTRDIELNDEGARDAVQLAQLLRGLAIAAIYSSPRRRARATVERFAASAGMEMHIEPGLDEIDFGAWSGLAFAELEREPQWSVWCNARRNARPPGGETIMEVQARVIAAMQRLRARHSNQTIALVSHGDVIKVALAHYLRLDLDDLERFDIAPASISVVLDDGAAAQVRLVNATRRWLP